MSTTPFYKNTKDALAEVGISTRQLAYWRNEGIFTPQLGDNKRYTAPDIHLLKFLKKLIDPKDGYGLPIETVRRLLPTLRKPERQFWGPPKYIDLDRDKFVTDYSAFSDYMKEAGRNYSPFAEDEFLAFALKVLQHNRAMHPEPKLYAVAKESFFEKLHEIELMARLVATRRDLTQEDWDYYSDRDEPAPDFLFDYALSPALSDDPRVTDAQLHELALKRSKLLMEDTK